MWQRFCSWLLYRQLGWKKTITEEHPKKYVLCLAPHTSNWDFILGQLYASAEGMKVNFLMKKEWFFWPLGIWLRKLGGFPVWRNEKSSMTDHLAESAREAREFRLCVTPEGTRSLNKDWKKGFYFIALKAEIPILLYGIDFQKKIIVCSKTVIPSGDVDKDMEEIKDYYKGFVGKHPEKFGL